MNALKNLRACIKTPTGALAGERVHYFAGTRSIPSDRANNLATPAVVPEKGYCRVGLLGANWATLGEPSGDPECR